MKDTILTARPAPAAVSRGIAVNDCHSRLNATEVRSVHRPASLNALCQLVRQAKAAGLGVSVCGKRHAMGGQQFGEDLILVDTSALNQVLHLDTESGVIEVEAGITWPEVQAHLDRTRRWHGENAGPHGWAIHQKQTGADNLTLGGSLAANIHGRGLTKAPLVGDIDSFLLIDAEGEPRRCSRMENPELFSRVIGGYGLFGIVYSLRLRLVWRKKMRRSVCMAPAQGLHRLFQQRIEDGFEFGDFQFVTDETSPDFLTRGIFACYEPEPHGWARKCDAKRVTRRQWLDLVHLAHTRKALAYQIYSSRYLQSNGRVYWSDELQQMLYVEGYHEVLDRRMGCACPHSEMITEIMVPRPAIAEFLNAARDDLRRLHGNVIYGTVRLVEKDTETALAWAREPWACVIFNLCLEHSTEGLAQGARQFQQLIDRGLQLGGTYYLTYHRFARRDQVERAHPRLESFLREKEAADPHVVFRSAWFDHYQAMFAR